jgi:hypothetical protein
LPAGVGGSSSTVAYPGSGETAPVYIAGVCRATLDYARAVVCRDEVKVEPSTETSSVINE